MEDTGLTERLLLFGMTRQEALIYLCLVQNKELTGYEAAKQTGISRSNVYSALAGLAEKGAAYLIEGASNKYVAVAAEEFCENRIRRMEEEKKYLVKNMPVVNPTEEGYITIEGYRHIMDKIYHMLASAAMRVYFSASKTMIEKFEKELLEMAGRGIKVVLISDEELEFASQKEIVFYRKEPQAKLPVREEGAVPVRLIIDSAKVLTGEISESAADTCLYSAQKNFVNLLKEAMRNEIELIELTEKRQYEEKKK